MNFSLTISQLDLQVLILALCGGFRAENNIFQALDLDIYLIYNIICMTVGKNPREAKSDGAQGGSTYSDK